MNANEGLIAATAMSLYIYNVSADKRAEKLYHHFADQGLPCGDPDDFLRWVDMPYWATEMPAPTALVYLEHAVTRYGAEAEDRLQANLQGWPPEWGGR